MDLLAAVQPRVTRLDLATDFETDLKPSEFVSAGWSDRIGSRGSFTSATGDTEYVGSAKSERYARVYRYAAPHPRAALLRIEHVMRRDYARSIIPFMLEFGLEDAQRTVGQQMGWQHPLWSVVGVQELAWKPPRNDRKTSGTERWLITQAASAFKKLVVQGVIEDPHAWLVEHFLKDTIDVRQLPLELE